MAFGFASVSVKTEGAVKMKALRKIVKPENHRVTIELPDEFNKDESVEVIILPVENKESPGKKRHFGAGKGEAIIHDSFYEPLEDFKDYM